MDLASLLGRPGLSGGIWFQVDGGHISGADVAAWPYSVGIPVRFTSFFEYLALAHWF